MAGTANYRAPPPLVYAVVLTWNNFADTDECLASLAAQDYPNYRMVVVDNGSQDGSLARLKERWAPRVRFLEMGTNLGVPAGYNAGLRLALDEGADYALLLNNDIVVAPDLIARLVEAFGRSPRLGAVGPVTVYYDARDRIWYAGGIYNQLLGYTRHAHMDKSLSVLGHRCGRVSATDYVTGCAIMLSRRALLDVGLLDESYHLYQEDTDWCLRARLNGYICGVVNQPLVAHKVSLSLGLRGSNVLGPRSAYFYGRNAFKLAHRHIRGVMVLPFLLGQFFVRLPYYCLGMALASQWQGIGRYLAGVHDGLKLLWRQREAPP